jgi:hypothetical protein
MQEPGGQHRLDRGRAPQVGGRDRRSPPRQEARHLHPRRIRRRLGEHHGEVDVAEVDRLPVMRIDDPHLDRRPQRPERPETRDQPADRHRRDDPDGERRRPAGPPRPPARGLDVAERPPERRRELRAMRQQRRPIGLPLEKRRPEPGFEPAHLVADRRLSDAELLRRPAEAAVAGNGLEDAERAERRLGHRVLHELRSCCPEKPSFDKSAA